jgi:hypothetical protein
MWQEMESLEYGLYTIAYSKEEALDIIDKARATDKKEGNENIYKYTYFGEKIKVEGE